MRSGRALSVAAAWVLACLLASAGLTARPAIAAPAVERVERGTLVLENIPEIPARIAERLMQYQNTRSASLRGWLPGGAGILISTRFAETTQIHSVAAPGGARRQITFFEEPVSGGAPSPDASVNGFIFGKDVGGSEFYQLFFHDLGTGTSRMLTDGKSRNGAPVWSSDGKRFAFYTTRRNGTDWDIHIAGVDAPGESVAVLESEGAWIATEWSPDDTRLLVARYISANEVQPHVLDIATKTLTRINPSPEKISYSAGRFSRDGKGIYIASDEGSEFRHLRYYDLATGRMTVLTGDIPWDVEELALSRDGEHLAFTVNEDGISRLYLRNLPGMTPAPLPEIPTGQIYGLEFSPEGGKLGMVLNTASTPGDVYSVDVDGRGLQRWTHSEVGGLASGDFVTPELIHYETFDQVDGKPRMIPAFYYRPRGEGPHPVVVSIHGGPEGQSRPYFSSNIQYWVNELGLAVIQPNVRGSEGYGKSYLKLDNGMKREDSVKDIGKLLDWAGTRPELDADRVAVYGGSYGGYMVLASMVHFNDRLRAGVDIVGISNFVTFLQNTKDYRRDLRRVEYGDERDAEMRAFLERISPANSADKITRPLFIAQGLNDPRVPVTESEQMVEVIRANGGPVWYMLARDEGHGFRKKANKDYYEAAVSLFLEHYLLQRPLAEAAD